MIENYNFNIDKIPNLSQEEKSIRKKNLDIFFQSGFPNKKLEDWKFTDLNLLISKNFQKLTNIEKFNIDKKLELLNNFQHNYVYLINGKMNSYNFNYEEKNKIIIDNFNNSNRNVNKPLNSLNFLNDALAIDGFYLEIKENYKLKKPLIIYNFFSNNLKDVIISNKNSIKINKGSSVDLIEYTLDDSDNCFIKNTTEQINLDEGSNLNYFVLQGSKCNNFFYKLIKGKLKKNSNYNNYILTSGLKFNKIEFDIELNDDNSNCEIYSALNLKENNHQEIKTLIAHNSPYCRSYQVIKTVLNDQSKGVYQGKIYVKNQAQKTNAYQLSKTLILNDKSEFNAKPELEIYADDVKCSHGSTSGSIDENSIYYLMTRGISEIDAKKLLIKGFLADVLEKVKNQEIKMLFEENLERQVNGS
ncbi:MAG: Fe-S cluster assembly protein SufD [Pelagibacteraceae bacterium]